MQSIRQRVQTLSPIDRARYDRIADQFDAAWRANPENPPDLSAHLPSNEPVRTLLLVALVRTDLEARRDRNEVIRVEDYIVRYPELQGDDSAQIDLISWEYKLAQPGKTQLEEYFGRFPHLADLLNKALTGFSSLPWTAPPGYSGLQEIGRGGMGVVYLAWQERLKRQVALKVLSRTLLADPTALARFRKESEIVAGLQHPNIVALHEIGEHQSQPFCVLEYYPGGSLLELLRQAALGPREAAQLVMTLARAVQAAHEKGVIHRDLKPANVLLAADGTIRLADFGLARHLEDSTLTKTGDLVGTLHYMAPEQARGWSKEIGPAVDVYSLGAILYHCLPGTPPFQGSTSAEILTGVLNRDPAPPSTLVRVPRDLETICLKCLSKAPGQRYASARDLADDLERYLNGDAIRARRPSLLEQIARWTRRRPAAALALAVAVVGPLTLALVVGSYNVWLTAQTQAALSASAKAELRKQQTLRAANVLVDEVARGVEPIPGIRAADVRKILDAARFVFDDLLQADPSPEVREAAGRLHNHFAAIYLKINDTAQAAKETEAGWQAFEQLLIERPDHPSYRSGLADSLEKKGQVLLVSGDLPAALQNFRFCQSERQTLVKEEANADRKAGLATAHVWVGTTLQAQGNWQVAQKEYDQALTLRRELAGPSETDASAEQRRALAEIWERLGNLALERGQHTQAADHYRRALRFLTPLAEAKDADTPVRKSFERARVYLAQSLLLLRQNREPMDLLQASLPGIERGRLLDPDDLDWQRMWFLAKVGFNLQTFREPTSAANRTAQVKAWEEILRFADDLVKKDPRNHILQAEVAAAESALAAVYYQRGNRKEAPAESFSRAVEIQERAIARLQSLLQRDPSNKEFASGLQLARPFLEVLKMRKAGATAPRLPGLTDPEYLAVARSEVSKQKEAFKKAQNPANAGELAMSCLTVAELLRKGNYEPYLAEARALLAEARIALQTAGKVGKLDEIQQDLLAAVEKLLQELRIAPIPKSAP